MNNFIKYVKSIFSCHTKQESADQKAKKRCPASSLCLGCDGAINCSLARLTVKTTVEAGH